MEIVIPSKTRQPSDCSSYRRCGGCNLRHMQYHETLEFKKNMVQNLTNKTLEQRIQVKDTIGIETKHNIQ